MSDVINLEGLLKLVDKMFKADLEHDEPQVQAILDEMAALKWIYHEGINFECWRDSLTCCILLIEEAGEERGVGLIRGADNDPEWKYIGSEHKPFKDVHEALTLYMQDCDKILSKKIGTLQMIRAKVKEALE